MADKVLGQMPQHGQLPQGDMYVEYTVMMPTSVSDDTREGERAPISLCLELTCTRSVE